MPDRVTILRCRSGRPCPICGHDSWCGISADGGMAFCMRMQSDRPMKPSDIGQGWMHRLQPGQTPAMPRPSPAEPAAMTRVDWLMLQRQCRADLSRARLTKLSATLGVSECSLSRLGIGYSPHHLAWTFPMWAMPGGSLLLTGLRRRAEVDHAKKAWHCAKLGVCAPADFENGDDHPLLICEGESDTAAALDLGFDAIGRPGCEACREVIGQIVHTLRRQSIVIVADRDTPGQRGAHALAESLAARGRRVRVLTLPDAKDLRTWKALPGSSCHDLQAMIDRPAEKRVVPTQGRVSA